MQFCPIYNLRRLFSLIVSVGGSNATKNDIAWVRKEISDTFYYYITFGFLK